MWKKHTQPQPGTSSPCWSHITVGWHPILQLGHSGMTCTPKLIPQVSSGLEVRTSSSPLPNSGVILEVINPVCEGVVILEDRVQSQTVEIWNCLRLQNLISISLCFKIAADDDKPCFSSEGDAAPNHHTASNKSCFTSSAAMGIARCMSSPHFDPTVQL